MTPRLPNLAGTLRFELAALRANIEAALSSVAQAKGISKNTTQLARAWLA